MEIDEARIKQLILEKSKSANDSERQVGAVLKKIKEELGLSCDNSSDQVILDVFYDLFRVGSLNWGMDTNNPCYPWFHFTRLGEKAYANLSRDPSNSQGYKKYLQSKAALDDLTLSYVEEALNTFNNSCYKASAIMIGAASESILLNLRDTLVNRMYYLRQNVPNDLKDWRVSKIIKALQGIFDSKKGTMPNDLKSVYEQSWLSLTNYIRELRNDAGHPNPLGSISEVEVHCALLIFPELARMVNKITDWVNNGYS